MPMSVDVFYSIYFFFPYITLKNFPSLFGVKFIFSIHTEVRKERGCGRICAI